jgi:Flp pilus assembly protein TadD
MRSRLPNFVAVVLAVAPTAARAPAQPEPTTAGEFLERGNLAVQKGRPGEAIKDFSSALALDPKSASAYTARGTAYLGTGELLKSSGDFTDALALDPKNARAYVGRGNARAGLGATGPYT